ncbi:ROK family protein [Acidimicrobium ferrooxidans]|uniref:ROK family protein n=1 Tax=Acidimicrobium ferrooxidans TaxID=53635 RepID=A0ABS3ANY7_9ACTN|nr:ROK family protein [Acidimicrobium ferrooxidans]
MIAIDIGGTKIECGVVAGDGRVTIRRRVLTGGGTEEDLFELVASTAERVRDEAASLAGATTPVMCGVGCGGPMDMRADTVSPLNIAQWDDFPLRSRLEARLGLPTHVDNDAKALTLAEGWIGAAVGEPNFLAMVVSTGVGAGIVSDGRLLDGRSGNSGHIGHVVVVPDGRLHAGIAGTLEGEASGTAIAAHTGRPAKDASVEWQIRTGKLVGRAVGSVCNLLDMKLAVVAGSVALGFGAVFFDAANDELGRVALLDHSLGARIVPAGLGSDGPLVGAAAVAWYRSGYRLGDLQLPTHSRSGGH